MDILFENQFVYTEELYKELYYYNLFKKPKSIIWHIFLILSFSIGVLALLFPEALVDDGSAKIAVFLPLFLWIVIFRQHRRAMKANYKQNLELNNGKPVQRRMVLTNDDIYVDRMDDASGSCISYSSVKKIGQSKNYYYLITQTGLHLIFKKDGFVTGNLEDFLVFLRRKGFKC